MLTQEELVLVNTNIGGWFFDAILRTEHTTSLTITEHPVEDGAAISDHAYVNPAQVIMDIGMTDVAQDIVTGQFSGPAGRSVTAYQLLTELQRTRVPLKVVTRLATYENMLIETIVTSDDQSTQHGLKATITMKEIFVVAVTTVKLSAQPQATDSTPKGALQPRLISKSAAEWILEALGYHAKID